MPETQVEFSDDEIKTAFVRLSESCYRQNFGTMSKSDMELLMFDIYIEHLLANHQDFSDYKMSKVLGITQSRVRALKIRKELRYPHQGFEWKTAFVNCIPNAVYNKDTHLVQVLIPDVNVLIELRYYMESNGMFTDYTLNPKLFCCSIDYFLKLLDGFGNEQLITDSSVAERLREQMSNEKLTLQQESALAQIARGAWQDGIKELMKSAGKELLVSILQCLPFGGIAAGAVKFLIDVVAKS